jgi:hypothetical protein
MREELARRLLAKLMGWSAPELVDLGGSLQTLARIKYDEYEGFRPGEKFLESLAGWLEPFGPADKKRLVDFILRSLIYLSRPELDHLLDTVYTEIIRPQVLASTATLLGVPGYKVAQLASSEEFRRIQRSMLICGLSDGARLDRLRRASPQLRHEQFYPSAELTESVQDSSLAKLRAALPDAAAKFTRVLLVEDFSGSGFSLLRNEEGTWDGKLWRAHQSLDRLAQRGVLSADYSCCVIVYVASDVAHLALANGLGAAGWGWDLAIGMTLGDIQIRDDRLLALAEEWFDPVLITDHLRKGGPKPALGFAGAALPLVLFHNAPNNSISLLWGDSTGRLGAADRRALFPREERHRADS